MPYGSRHTFPEYMGEFVNSMKQNFLGLLLPICYERREMSKSCISLKDDTEHFQRTRLVGLDKGSKLSQTIIAVG